MLKLIVDHTRKSATADRTLGYVCLFVFQKWEIEPKPQSIQREEGYKHVEGTSA